MRQQTSQRGINLIRGFERFEANPYRCPAGLLTIGYGHVIRKTDCIVPPLTLLGAEALLRNDLAPIEIYLSGVLPGIPQNEFDALASLIFNIGLGAFEKSTLFKLLKAGNKLGAAAQFLLWNKVKGQSLAGLTRRRTAERDMFSELL